MELGEYGMKPYLLRLVACLLLCVSLNSFGAYYAKTDGTIVDTIMSCGASSSGGSCRDSPYAWEINYSGPNLVPEADLSDTEISQAKLWSVDLSGANLSNVIWASNRFNDGNFSDALMDNGIFYHSNFTNTTLSNVSMIGAELHNANLSGSDMSNSNLLGAELQGAILNNVNLSGANLTNTYFSFNDFTSSDLSNTNFTNARVWGVNFSDSDFSGSNLSQIDLDWDGAIYTNAIYSESTTFPTGFDPAAEGMIFVSEVPLPAGIYLFLSGLVGLGLIKRRK